MIKKILETLKIRHETDVPLAPRTWYGLGGNAEVLAHPASVQQFAALIARCNETSTPIYILGSGANLLVDDKGVSGVTIELDDPQFKQMTIQDHIVTAAAGYSLEKLVLDTTKAGLSGLEVLAGIPATIGGAIRMNAGGAFGEIGPTVRRIQVMDRCGQIYYRHRDDLLFSYRKTNIVAPFILEAEFELTPQDPDELIKRVKEIFFYKKTTQPLRDHSAGCVFKNPTPPIDQDPIKPAYQLSAGALIDQANLKGYCIGGAQVSTRHANFIITEKNCKSSNVIALIKHIQQVVLEKFEITLEREITLWP